jgi:hypothetical protein
MLGVPAEVAAAERARWLADLSAALNQAHQLLVSLDLEGERSLEARELHWRIEAARLEVQSLRLSRSVTQRPEKAPEWTDSLPWRLGGPEAR